MTLILAGLAGAAIMTGLILIAALIYSLIAAAGKEN